MEVVQGRTATTFEPDATLTRAEMVKIALLTFGYEISEEEASFSDVVEGSWYENYVGTAKKAGIVGGYEDGTFRPENKVTRGEALKILLLAAKVSATDMAAATESSFVDVDQEAWYAEYVNYGFMKNIVSGKDETHFAPGEDVTRGEMAKMAVKAYEM
jgi:hypothetical protein